MENPDGWDCRDRTGFRSTSLHVIHIDGEFVRTGGEQRGFIDHIGQIGAAGTCRTSRQPFEIHIRLQFNRFAMNLQDRFTFINIGKVDHHLAIETSRPE